MRELSKVPVVNREKMSIISQNKTENACKGTVDANSFLII